MPLTPGHSLTHYQILAPLGAGGMGEVWRGRDTRLDREVAIKVLPEELADDEERLRRFEREHEVRCRRTRAGRARRRRLSALEQPVEERRRSARAPSSRRALNTAGVVQQKTLYDTAGIDKRTATAYEQLLKSLFAVDAAPIACLWG